MTPVRKLDDYPQHERGKMSIPLTTTVQAYIKEKMGWPDAFCKYYAEKFWNHYQSQGWKLSNGNAMKDWRAAFSSNWQTPKYKEDLEKLNAAKIADAKENGVDPIAYINECLALHKSGQYKPQKEEVLQLYGWLKENGYVTLTKDEINDIVERGGNHKERMRMLAVRVLFDKWNAINYTLKHKTK